jgi:outer membrane protein assembly factor BamB
VVVVVSILLAAAACSGSDAPAPPVARASTDWATAGGGTDNARVAKGTTWSVASVPSATEAWTTEVAELGGLPTTPIVVGDVVYVGGTSGVVAALDRSSGRVRWKTEASGFTIGPTGVAVAGGRVFGLKGSTGVVAYDAGDGHQLWSKDVTETPTTGIDIQPVVHDGLVLVSTVPVSVQGIYKGGDHGVIHALDAATGAERWAFDTVEDGLWGNPAVNSGGGAWYPPAVDEARGLVYFGIANPAPFPGTKAFPNGTSRPGDNLYTDSLVALDLETGKLRWYRQVIPHDLFDRDQVMALIARPEGGEVVVSSGKSGIVVGLDPDTGKELWRTPVGKHDNDDLTALDGETSVYPGTYGGVLTPPSSADGVVYLPVVNSPAKLEPDEEAYFGTAMGTEDGTVAAVDAATGKVVWSREVPGDPLGGTTVVGDLLLVPLLSGKVLGLDRATGKTVWQADLHGSTNGQPAVSGDLVVFPVGTSAPPKLVAYRVRG